MKTLDILEHGSNFFLSNLSTDIVIIGYQEEKLKCLLLKMGDKWLLPGGYIKQDESVDDATFRILFERTHLTDPHLKFLSVFGERDRRFGKEFKIFFEENGFPWKESYWINNRFVSLAYYSLVDIDKTHPQPGELDEAAEWFSLEALPNMWLDHEAIVNKARERLREDIQNEQITYNLLPTEFTMPQLHQLHQTILGEPLDRSRFQKKMLATGLFDRLPKLQKESRGSNPYQYRIKRS